MRMMKEEQYAHPVNWRMAPTTVVSGKMNNDVEGANKYNWMVQYMKDNGAIINIMGMAD